MSALPMEAPVSSFLHRGKACDGSPGTSNDEDALRTPPLGAGLWQRKGGWKERGKAHTNRRQGWAVGFCGDSFSKGLTLWKADVCKLCVVVSERASTLVSLPRPPQVHPPPSPLQAHLACINFLGLVSSSTRNKTRGQEARKSNTCMKSCLAA